MNGYSNFKSSLAMLGIGLSLGLCLNTIAGQIPPRGPKTVNERKVFLNEFTDSLNRVVVNHEEQVRSGQGVIDRLRLLESRLNLIRRAANGYRRRATSIEQLLATIESNTNENAGSSEAAISRMLSVQEAFEMISKIMKSQHETAKGIIQNIRG